MTRALRVCPTPGCPQLTKGGRCPKCARTADQKRGTAAQRGYTARAHQAFRHTVLDRDPICVICHLVAATVADHWPTSKRDLDDAGLNSNDPTRGRGLCASCHSRETATNQPGGWNNRHTP